MVSAKKSDCRETLLMKSCNNAVSYLKSNKTVFLKIFCGLLLIFICSCFLKKGLSTSSITSESIEDKRGNEIAIFESKPDKLEPVSFNNQTIIRSEIAIYVIVNKTTDWKMYELAQASVACYCKMFNYSLIQVSIDSLPSEIAETCQVHKDYNFKRHCVTAQIFQRHPEIKWFFFQGADAGIINPLHFLEDYIDDRFDMTWLQAGFNYDIFTDAYLARNNNFSYDFLMSWVQFEWKAPKKFYSGDTGAIYQVLLEKFKPLHPRHAICRGFWHKAQSYVQEQRWVACAKSIFNESTEIGPVRFTLPMGHDEWLRNVSFSDGFYSSNDFMLHNWIQRGKSNSIFISNVAFPLDKCSYSKEGLDLWRAKYKQESYVQNSKVWEIVKPKLDEVTRSYNEILPKIDYNPF